MKHTGTTGTVVPGPRRSPRPPRPVAIFGGAFDPVTNAHLAVAERVAAGGFAVVFLPCGDTHAFGKRLLPARDRIELLRAALAKRFEISTLEIESGCSHTIDTWPLAVRRYGPVHWIIGSDHATAMHRWHDGARLIATLARPRTGVTSHPTVSFRSLRRHHSCRQRASGPRSAPAAGRRWQTWFRRRCSPPSAPTAGTATRFLSADLHGNPCVSVWSTLLICFVCISHHQYKPSPPCHRSPRSTAPSGRRNSR